LPSAKHFQTAAEGQYSYSADFSSGHINKENNFTSCNYFMRENIHSCFALWDKMYTLELFCHQTNMISWTGHMTSLNSLT